MLTLNRDKTEVFFPQRGQHHVEAIFLQSLSASSLQRINRQIKWGIKVCQLRKKIDSAKDLLIGDKILPAELFIKKNSRLGVRKLHDKISNLFS